LTDLSWPPSKTFPADELVHSEEDDDSIMLAEVFLEEIDDYDAEGDGPESVRVIVINLAAITKHDMERRGLWAAFMDNVQPHEHATLVQSE
jgi:hypothetical protein